MIIAIPTNDRVNIAQKSGRAKEFVFWNLETNEKIFKENPHKHEHEHHEHHNHSHKDMIDMIKNQGADTLIVDVVGKHFKKDLFDGNIKIYKTNLKSLKEISEKFKENKNSFEMIGE